MFDIGFGELVLVLVVALVVVGPERLPGLVRTVGFLLGKTKRTLNSIRAEIAQELAAEELKNTIRRHTSSESFDEIIEETRKAIEPAASGEGSSKSIPTATSEDLAQMPADVGTKSTSTQAENERS